MRSRFVKRQETGFKKINIFSEDWGIKRFEQKHDTSFFYASWNNYKQKRSKNFEI